MGQLLQLCRDSVRKETDWRTQLAKEEFRKLLSAFLSATPSSRKRKIFNKCVLPRTRAKGEYPNRIQPRHISRDSERDIIKGSPMNRIWNEMITTGSQVREIILEFRRLNFGRRSRLGKRSLNQP